MDKKSVSFDGGPVGYKRPPAEHQFRKGEKPRGSGRKKGSKNYATFVPEIMDSRVSVSVDGVRQMTPVRRALFLRAVSRGLTGNVKDVERVYALEARLLRLTEREAAETLTVYFQNIPGDDW